jgi:hypothetical protein
MGEPVEVLSVGSVVGGSTPTNRRWRDAIAELTRAVAEARTEIASPLNVNVVFQVAGNVVQPDFEGARTGQFSKANRLLLVQVALPAEVADDPESYLRGALSDAIDEAEGWARERSIAPDLQVLRELVAGL